MSDWTPGKKIAVDVFLIVLGVVARPVNALRRAGNRMLGVVLRASGFRRDGGDDGSPA